jgi:hypothetical protein
MMFEASNPRPTSRNALGQRGGPPRKADREQKFEGVEPLEYCELRPCGHDSD